MVAHTTTMAFDGIRAVPVDVQAQLTSGMTSFQVVGLPNNAVKESRERVRSAFHSIGIQLPAKRIIVNLAPADLMKEGSHFDLPIAVGLLQAMQIAPAAGQTKAVFMGELALDGRIHPVPGCLPAAISAEQRGCDAFFCPEENADEAAQLPGISVYGVTHIAQVLKHLKGEELLSCHQKSSPTAATSQTGDFADVKGQETAKRACEIAAAGGHNLLLCGPPGAGKSMLAQRLPSILTPLEHNEALEISAIHSIAGTLHHSGLLQARPFRSPHHNASAVALAGGGLRAKPGEMSLAHRGILFLDELPEFPRQVLETLRQPLESGTITVSRANHHVTYPARFQLVAAMNPCPCGYLGHPRISCKDSQRQVQSYRSRISGPLMDRIDLHIDVPVLDVADLTATHKAESSAVIAQRVAAARKRQHQRYAGTQVQTNAEVDGKALGEAVNLSSDDSAFMAKAVERFVLSGRGYHRVLRVARTIADLAGSETVTRPHLAEALNYRPLQTESY